MEHLYPYPKMGTTFLQILHDPLTRKLLGFDAVNAEPIPFVTGVTSRLKFLINDAAQQLSFLKIGYTALEAFLQVNCTGPPLLFHPDEALFPETYRAGDMTALKEDLFEYLAVDGSRPYSLTPHIGLFWLAKVILSNPALAEAGFNGRRARFRVNCWHQRLLSEDSPTLRDIISSDAQVLEQQLRSRLAFSGAAAEEHFVEFLIERAVIRTRYGEDTLARTDLAQAASIRHFQFVLTGALGKRTKFQDRDISQLVVLAKSRDHEPEPYSSRKNSRDENAEVKPDPTIHLPMGDAGAKGDTTVPHRPAPSAKTETHHGPTSPLASPPTKPENLLLNDDTLLERIAFKATDSSPSVTAETMTHITPSDSSLSPQLASLDPENQPLLFPMDSIILLATASSITNTSPEDGLVREETLPYATRVLDGGSSNWQVYTQALLVRSRIEGYKARTVERGLLQLQALVDQVIAQTSQVTPAPTDPRSLSIDSATSPSPSTEAATSTFLPKPTPSESASVSERLKYIYQLSPPLRWELEAELAQRWTSLGGLKTALEIYERLQMHAEVALCLAATDQEGKAVELLKGLLFRDEGGETVEAGKETLRSPPPSDAPRLLCILGDITSSPQYYTLSWTVSQNRYARAQRSLGKHFTKARDFPRAAEAYTFALNISRLDRASWFSLGCIQLELEEYGAAVESFTRCVQLEDKDAESWSNLAVALLRLPQPLPQTQPPSSTEEPPDSEVTSSPSLDPYRHTFDALRALRRAATLKRDDARIWDNYLTVAASIPPSANTPWGEIIQAMSRVVELREKKEGEGCVDLRILRVLMEYVTGTWVYPSEEEDGEDGRGSEKRRNGDGAVEDSPTAETVAQSRPQDQISPIPTDPNTTTVSNKLPYLPRSFLSLIDLVTPLATSSSPLYTLLSLVSLWRHRPSLSLSQAEKSWLCLLTSVSASEDFSTLTPSQWELVVDKTIWLIGRYRELGPMSRERTGGEVEAKWRFKARSAGRRVLGRAKTWEETGDEAYGRLKTAMEEL